MIDCYILFWIKNSNMKDQQLDSHVTDTLLDDVNNKNGIQIINNKITYAPR